MFDRLQKKWKVGGLQLLLILCTFAIGGSLTGFIGKKIMNALALAQDWLWAIVYILLVTMLWPAAVLLVSFFFGQYRFFSNYIRKIGIKLGLVRSEKAAEITPVAIFASGAGSNTRQLIDHFRNHRNIRISLILTNNREAGVIHVAESEKIPVLVLDREKFFSGNGYVDELRQLQIEYLVLAGFLWKIPGSLLDAFPAAIINIHPALLPAYGGKGMYGRFVHEAVLAAGEKTSGISIHLVDELYDHGTILFQTGCPVAADETVATLTQKVQALEHAHYPAIIEKYISSKHTLNQY